MEIKTFDLITNWKERVNDLQKFSYAQAIKFDKYHYVIGTSAVIFSAVAGAFILLAVSIPWVKWAIGAGSIFAAIILASQTFFTHSKRSEKYRFNILQLVNIRRDIELYEKFIPSDEAERNQRILEIDERIQKIEEESSNPDDVVRSPRWPWGLLGTISAVLFFILVPLSIKWIMNLYSVEISDNNWVRESIQQGTQTWEFDPTDPMVEQRVILINTWINEMTTQKAITLLNYLNEEGNQKPISIYLSSTGGYTKDAIAIVNAIQGSNAPVNTTAIGDCFSACAMILMSGTGERLVAPTSRIMIHTHSYPLSVDLYAENTVRYEREIDFFETYSNIPANWINREENLYYLTPEQALTFEVVDRILE